jgi:hypothetical protein
MSLTEATSRSPTDRAHHGGTTGAGPRAAAIGAARAMTRLSGRHDSVE